MCVKWERMCNCEDNQDVDVYKRQYSSESRILYEWTDDGDTIRIYLEDAEPGDSGEIIVHK